MPTGVPKPSAAERQQLIKLIRSCRHNLDESWQIADAVLEAGYRLPARVRDRERLLSMYFAPDADWDRAVEATSSLRDAQVDPDSVVDGLTEE